MGNFITQLEKANRLTPKSVSDDLFDFIKTLKDFLIELNKNQINQDSQDIYGKAIGFYSKATDIMTDGRKEWGTPFTGKDTGKWLDSWYVTVLDDIFYFGTTDPKTDDILTSKHWLSHSLFGLTDTNLQHLIDSKLRPFILDYYKNQLGL